MGNTCVVCNEGGNLFRYYTTLYDHVYYKHFNCVVKCKACNEIHDSENYPMWFEKPNSNGKIG